MQVEVAYPEIQTFYFSLIVVPLLLFSLRKRVRPESFSTDLTNELKGVAILAVLFFHIGYLLSSSNRFLYPYSIISGVGVNLFLLLSGYGLTKSHLKKPLSVFQFYTRRLLKLYIPLWISLIVFLLIDFFVLQRSYPALSIISSFTGFYPRADISINLNSPLWYFTLILFYYLLYPLLTFKRLIYISPVLLYIASNLILRLDLPVHKDVIKMYSIHNLAFPLGVFFAIVTNTNPTEYLKNILKQLHDHNTNFFTKLTLRVAIIITAVLIFGYTAVHSNVGAEARLEETTSLVTVFALLLIFYFKRYRFKLLELIGLYSYEIYLIHWPILYRYDFLYKFFPPFLATVLYLAIFMALSLVLQKLSRKVAKALPG